MPMGIPMSFPSGLSTPPSNPLSSLPFPLSPIPPSIPLPTSLTIPTVHLSRHLSAFPAIPTVSLSCHPSATPTILYLSSHLSHCQLCHSCHLSCCQLCNSAFPAIFPTVNMSLAAASQLPTIPGSILWMSSIGLVVDCTYCGLAVLLTICQSDKNGNAGKPMARHPKCKFFKFFPELLQYPDILNSIPLSSPSPTISPTQPPPMDSASTLVFCPSLEWEAVLDYIFNNDGNGLDELQQALQVSMAAQPTVPLHIPLIHELMGPVLSGPAASQQVMAPLQAPLEPPSMTQPPSAAQPARKQPRITNQLDPTWACDLCAWAQQEIEEGRTAEC
ncbi:hypothetical protein EDB19DRAFT_1908677 [Suillus lakei]|nr:hypothetical protein EDB19DRAFT_1908677 [Suillus lakei]